MDSINSVGTACRVYYKMSLKQHIFGLLLFGVIISLVGCMISVKMGLSVGALLAAGQFMMVALPANPILRQRSYKFTIGTLGTLSIFLGACMGTALVRILF